MGVRFPADLAAWQRWQRQSQRLRRAKHAITGIFKRLEPRRWRIGVQGRPRVLAALETSSPTALAALAAPLHHLHDFAVIVPAGFDESLLPGNLHFEPWDGCLSSALPEGGVVLSTGHYLPLGYLLYRQSRVLPVEFVTVQHGLITHQAPPLARDSTLLAWTKADAQFWSEGQRGIKTAALGSQLLFATSQAPATRTSDRPVFLGQLHGAELPRLRLMKATFEFCKNNNATYRPHPVEVDKLSRLTHALWERNGIEIDRRPLPIRELGRPVVSIFSTGVLEAAALGLPSYVHYPNPPAWLADFWERYSMQPWGTDPTPPPELPTTEPAKLIASYALEAAS